ncbi:MAG TPA: oligosaccharide flippase family protein [Verrucomicrobiae bacterium]|jgi:O-antigen/teichoic acid export membrane protein|nr:oligosaccharide flippase family protein [Verrucomicrobiae bacterium]
MTTEELKKKIWSNSISNYLRLGLRLILGVLLFRMMFTSLPREEFGFWALLWSFFGYGILMDFGFGLAAQKKVAELSATGEWEKLSRMLSSIFYFYMIGAVIVITVGLTCSHWFVDMMQLSETADRAEFTRILRIFICYIGLSFPFGLSIEILYGQHRIALANNLQSLGDIVKFILVLLALQYQWGLKAIFIISIGCSFVPTAMGGWLGLKSLPGVKILPRYCSWELAKETMSFSLFAYVGTVTGLVMGQTDRLVLGVLLSVASVAIYQVGSKVADLFGQFTAQLPETLSPAAAHMAAVDDKQGLRRLMTEGARAQVTIATPMYLICAFWMEGFLDLLTKGQEVSGEAYWVGQLLLLWIYTMIITHSVPKKVFMMTGHHKRLTALSTIEAIANLILTVTFVLIFKANNFIYPILGVVLGSLLPSLVIGWGFLWPWASRYAGVSGMQLANHILFRNWAACMAVVTWGTLCHILPQAAFEKNKLMFFIEAGFAVVIAGLGIWYGSLTEADRTKFREQYDGVRAKVKFI